MKKKQAYRTIDQSDAERTEIGLSSNETRQLQNDAVNSLEGRAFVHHDTAGWEFLPLAGTANNE